MVLGRYDRRPPRWLFNPTPSGNPPLAFARIKDDDELLLYNAANSVDHPRSFTAYARVSEAAKFGDEFSLLLKEPMGRLNPVRILDLWQSLSPRVTQSKFSGLFGHYHRGPIDNLASHPGSAEGNPGRGARRWRVIMDAATWRLRL